MFSSLFVFSPIYSVWFYWAPQDPSYSNILQQNLSRREIIVMLKEKDDCFIQKFATQRWCRHSSVLFFSLLFSERRLQQSGNNYKWAAEVCSASLRFTMTVRIRVSATVGPFVLPMTLCMLTLLPQGLLGKPAEEENTRSSALLQRVKRGWVWNQFFVLEEYTGLEPLYIGKVGVDSQHGCTHTYTHTILMYLRKCEVNNISAWPFQLVLVRREAQCRSR